MRVKSKEEKLSKNICINLNSVTYDKNFSEISEWHVNMLSILNLFTVGRKKF